MSHEPPIVDAQRAARVIFAAARIRDRVYHRTDAVTLSVGQEFAIVRELRKTCPDASPELRDAALRRVL